MVAESDILQIFAEVDVAVAGFSGVVFILGKRVTGEWTRAEKLQFRILLDSSVAVVFFALLPLVLGFQLSSSAVWRLSAGLLGVFAVQLVAAFWVRALAHPESFPKVWRRLVIAGSLLGAFGAVACFLVAAGRLSEFAVFIYLILLLQLIGQALVNFMFLLRSGLTSR